MSNPCDFAFAINQPVGFVGSPHNAQLDALVLGRMEDCNGRHYELEYWALDPYGERSRVRARGWFTEAEIQGGH